MPNFNEVTKSFGETKEHSSIDIVFQKTPEAKEISRLAIGCASCTQAWKYGPNETFPYGYVLVRFTSGAISDDLIKNGIHRMAVEKNVEVHYTDGSADILTYTGHVVRN